MSQEKARTCYECENYDPISGDFGLCSRLEDCAGPSFTVRPQGSCLKMYSTPGNRLSPKEINERDSTAQQKARNFRNFLESASSRINSWPSWKKQFAANYP